MEILSPSTYVLDCKCECGSHFLATPKDIIKKTIRIVDPFWSSNQAWGDNTMIEDVNAIICPFCGNYVIMHSVTHKDIETKVSNGEDPCNHEVEPYDEADIKKYDKIEVKIKKWKEIPYLKDKYSYDNVLKTLNG